MEAEHKPTTEHRLPRDGGLGNLGLLMMYCGLISVLIWVIIALRLDPDTGLSKRYLPNVYLWLLGLASLYRSGVHAATGFQISRRTMPLLGPVKTYFNVSICHTIVTVFFLWGASAGRISNATIGAVGVSLMAWPTLLRFLVQKGPAQRTWIPCAAGGEPPIPRDLGQEGFGLKLAWMGLVGLSIGLFSSYVVYKSGLRHQYDAGWGLQAALALMVARSLVQATAGLNFLRGASISTVGRKIEIYRIMSWISFAVLVLCMILIAKNLISPPIWDLNKGKIIGTILAVGSITQVWPILVYRHATWILHNAQYELQNEPTRPLNRAIDGGWTSLGYILLALGTVAATHVLLRLSVGDPWAFHGNQELYSSIVLCATTLFAGWELIRMTKRAQLATRVYSLCAIAIVVMELAEKVPEIRAAGTNAQANLILLIAHLALPVLSLYLVHRPQIEEA